VNTPETEETGTLQTTAALTVSDSMQARVFHGWEGILRQPTSEQPEQQSLVCWQKNAVFLKVVFLIERAKFALHVMVSAGISFEGKGGLHFVDEKANVNADYYVNQLLPKLVGDCQQVLGEKFIFQQRRVHAAKVTQWWLAVHCPDFIDKDSWPPNSPDINPPDYHVWGSMLEKSRILSRRTS